MEVGKGRYEGGGQGGGQVGDYRLEITGWRLQVGNYRLISNLEISD